MSSVKTRKTRSFLAIAILVGVVIITALALIAVNIFNNKTTPNQNQLIPPPSAQQSGLDKQISSLQQRVQSRPDDAASYGQLGLSYLQKVREVGDPSYYVKAEAVLQKALELNPKSAEGIAGMGSLSLARHQFAQALEWGKKGADLYPSTASFYGVIGDALVELGRYDEAADAIQKMVNTRPDLSSYARVSYMRELRGEYGTAIEDMTLAARAAGPVAENRAWVTYQLGNLYLNHGDPTNADAAYQEALYVLPNYVYARAGLARLKAANGDVEGAISIYKQITTQIPLPEFLIEFGDLYTSLGKKDEATNQYEVVRSIQQLYKANGVNVDLELVLFDADRCEGDACRNPQFLATARQQAELRPSVKGHDTLAWVLYKAGDYTSARNASQQALKLGTQDPLLFFHAGMIEYKLGNKAEARSFLERAIKFNPNFSYLYAAEARQTLEKLKAEG